MTAGRRRSSSSAVSEGENDLHSDGDIVPDALLMADEALAETLSRQVSLDTGDNDGAAAYH